MAILAGWTAAAARSVSADENAVRLPENIRIGLIGIEGHYSDITSATKVIPNLHFTAIADDNADRLKSATRNAAFASAARFTFLGTVYE